MNSISKKFSRYSTLAVAMGVGVEAQAQHMVYTDVNPDTVVDKVLLSMQHYLLDLNNDNQFDFDLKLDYYYSTYNSDRMTVLKMSPASGNAVMDVVQTAPFVHFVVANNAGVQINAAQNWGSAYNEVFAIRQQSVVNSAIFGNWAGATDKYLGLKFQIGGATHYGWARLSVDSVINNFTLKDYAYDSVANETFHTGLITQTNSISNSNDFEVVVNNEFLNIDFKPQGFKFHISIFSMDGNSLLEKSTDEKHVSISLSDFPSGIYLLKLQDENFNSTVTRFSVIH